MSDLAETVALSRHPLFRWSLVDVDGALGDLRRAELGKGELSVADAIDSYARALARHAALLECCVAALETQTPDLAADKILKTVFRGEIDVAVDTSGLALAFATAIRDHRLGAAGADLRARDAWEGLEMALRRRGRRL
jgi:hypothetical protein